MSFPHIPRFSKMHHFRRANVFFRQLRYGFGPHPLSKTSVTSHDVIRAVSLHFGSAVLQRQPPADSIPVHKRGLDPW